MMQRPACETCANKDSAFVLHGNKYVEEAICVYDMVRFPKAMECDKYDDAFGDTDLEAA